LYSVINANYSENIIVGRNILMKIKLDRVTINVKNLEESKKFFSKLLNTTFEDEPVEFLNGKIEFKIEPKPDNFAKFKFAVSPIGIELFEPYPPPEKEGIRNVTWRVEDIDEAREEMKQSGIRRVFDTQAGSWRESVYSADDMHGVRWVLNEFPGKSVMKAILKEPKK
jgi:catechol 2,3-dioxygenase-like lactoylglutathione lyase family enzyme